jgi:acetylornithine deacetylase/succinyl-diaminopimelate desuccinylase-like protein
MTDPMTSLASLKGYFTVHRDAILADYFNYLRFPSISSEVDNKPYVQACAQWVMGYLEASGLQAELWPTAGHPTIFASHCQAGPDKPTLLLYGHYDVQPVDPLELWLSPPFEPTIRDGNVYARGAQDNKGQSFYTMLALRSLLYLRGDLPINIKVLIEGEEECGSHSLPALLLERRNRLAADALAVVDMGLPGPQIPAVTLGCRGLVALEVTVRGSSTDLHSGSHGGIVYNANHALVELLARLRRDDGSIAIPGFYDDVLPVSSEVRESLYLEFDATAYKTSFGALPTGGEHLYSPVERACLRPTVEINGICGGYTGTGVKTVIPASASAKLTCRLVPNQTPQHTAEKVAAFFQANVPMGIDIDVQVIPGGGCAVRADANSAVVRAFSSAYTELFNTPCCYVFEGGSIPIIPELQQASGGDVVLLGMGLNDDNIHAPNEHFGLDRLENGYLLVARAIELMGAGS